MSPAERWRKLCPGGGRVWDSDPVCVAATRAREGGGAAVGPVLTFAPCWRGRGRSGPVGLRGPAPCPCRTFPRGAPRLAVTALGTVHGRSEPQDRGPCPSAPCARGFLCSEEVEAQCASSAHIKLEGGGRRRHEPAREVGRAGPRHSPGGRKGERGPRLRPVTRRQALCTFGGGFSERAGLELWASGACPARGQSSALGS